MRDAIQQFNKWQQSFSNDDTQELWFQQVRLSKALELFDFENLTNWCETLIENIGVLQNMMK